MVKTLIQNNMNEYIELCVNTTHIGSEIVSDIFWNYTDHGVVIFDVEDVIALAKEGKTWDYADEKIFTADKTVVVKGYFKVEESDALKKAERDIIALKENAQLDFGTLETFKRNIDGDAWRESWKEHFKPIPIGKVVIVPEWINYAEKQGEIKVLLDSNMAFGTGEHETTSMCVEYLQQFVKPSDTVIDVGCGSGILGITAEKLGAKQVLMTDIDECAITATNHNMQLNGTKNGKALLKNLLDDQSLVAEVIVCNIMAEVLIAFAPHIGKNLKDDGIIILSGILADRLERVKSAYLENGFNFVSQKIKGEWSALVMQKDNI
ncbi:MAG: 50S ribosomal protein L11 methyltransferase [Clostridia bacterium]|nr:50S ribosomal protein L11 methyltransferase [Clostridia bacterium]